MDSKKFAEGVEQVWDVVKKSAKGETILNSNKSINKIGSTVLIVVLHTPICRNQIGTSY